MAIFRVPPPAFVGGKQPDAPPGPFPPPSSGSITNQQSLSATNPQSSAAVKSAAYFRSVAATDAQAATFVRLASRFRTLAAAGAQVAVLTTVRAYSRSLVTTNTNVAAVLRGGLYSRTLSLAATQSAALGRTVSAIRSAVASQSVSLARVLSFLRTLNATDGQIAARVLLTSIRRAAIETQAAALSAMRAFGRALSATDAQAAARSAAISLSRITSDGQSAARILLVSISKSAADAQQTGRLAAGLYARLLAVGSSQVPGLQKLAGILRSATDPQAIARRVFVSIARAATSAQTAALARGNSLARSVVDAQVAARTLLVSIRRSAVDGEVVSSAQGTGRSKILSAIDAQVAALVAIFIHAGINTGLALAALQAQAVRLVRSIGDIRRATAGQVSSRLLSVSVLRGISASLFSPEFSAEFGAASMSVGLARTIATLRSVAGGQVIARRLFVSVFRSAVSAESTARASSLSVARSAANTQVEALKRTSSIVRALGFAQGSLLTRTVSIARASFSAQIAAIVATHLGFTNPLSLAAIDAQVAALRRSVAMLRSALGAQALNVVRLVGAIRPIASPEVTARTLVVFKRFATTSSEATAGTALRAFLKACSALSSEAVALTRVGLHIPSALAVAAANSARLVKLASAVRRASNAMAAARGAFSIGLHLPADPLQVIGIAAVINRGRALVVQQAQSVLAFAAFHHFGNFAAVASTISGGTISLAKTIGKAFRVADPTAAASFSWYFRFVPLALRGRVVRLPPPQQFSALPPAARRVVLPEAQLLVKLPPAVRRVIVPVEGGDYVSDYEIQFPEPAFFSPLDPTDTDLFTFDWSVRGYPGDIIVFASIISVPSGVNFLGPAFISGQSVTITVGPFVSAPRFPMTYSLRCMCVFGSGRISNYSVPFEVMSL